MTTEHKYLQVTPRGFANEKIIFRVPVNKVAEATAEYAAFEDDVARGGSSAWVSGPFAPGILVDWQDRHLV